MAIRFRLTKPSTSSTCFFIRGRRRLDHSTKFSGTSFDRPPMRAYDEVRRAPQHASRSS